VRGLRDVVTHISGVRHLAQAREAVAAATDARREAASDRATWTARRDTLAISLRGQDGTAALLQAGIDGLLGPLAEHLNVERGWENAVAALLEAPVVDGRLDLESLGSRIPSATWAYTVTDNELGDDFTRMGRALRRRLAGDR